MKIKMKRTRSTGMARFLAVTLLVLLPGALPLAGEWASWRGPAGDGSSPETGLVSSWSKHGENLVWQADFIGVNTPYLSKPLGDEFRRLDT